MTDKTGTKTKTATSEKSGSTGKAPDPNAALAKRVKKLEDRVDSLVTRLGGAIGLSVEE